MRAPRAVALLGLLAATACSSGGSTTAGPAASSAPAPAGSSAGAPAPGTGAPAASGLPGTPAPGTPGAPPAPGELPRGGRTILPGHVVVAHYGTAGTGVLGVLGRGTPDQATARLAKAAAPFEAASGKPVLPALELITTVAQAAPGKSGDYSTFLEDAEVARYLDAARRAKMLVVLDIQPGRADFLEQVKRYERFLLEPEVGVALDPEWKLTPSQKPGRQIGKTNAASVNAVSDYLARLVADHGLPQKLFVVHQFKTFMIANREKLATHPELATVVHVDGFGTQKEKRQTYDALKLPAGSPIYNGFKLFYKVDTGLMTPKQTMALKPMPDLVSYQ